MQTYTPTYINTINQPSELYINESSFTLIGEKPFLVMVQTDSCLNVRFKSRDSFGNTTICQCDVLVLSFKKECKEASPAHIQYTFKPKERTWNLGRNKLFEIAKNRSEKYVYYIFVDDDIQLQTKLHIKPWLTFLQFLKEIEPAVGIIDLSSNIKHALIARQQYGCATSEKSTTYINAPNFDSAVNAFHYQAINFVLPYPTKFDNISWYYSGFYAKVKCDLTFPGQTVHLTKIIGHNPHHRPYPRRLPNARADWDIIMDEVAARLPEKYRNTTELRAWREGGWRYEDDSPTHCIPLPKPHMPVTPFPHL